MYPKYCIVLLQKNKQITKKYIYSVIFYLKDL